MLVYYWKKFDTKNLPDEEENLENLTPITSFYPHSVTNNKLFYPHFVTYFINN